MLEIKINLKKIRLEKGLTQKELAKKSGVSGSYISFLETGKRLPTIYILVVIAKTLDVKINELVDIKEDGFRSTFKYF